jgi:hypothetical protein
MMKAGGRVADCGLTPAAVDELELVVLDELLDQGLGLGVGLGPEALEEGLLDVCGRRGMWRSGDVSEIRSIGFLHGARGRGGGGILCAPTSYR